MKTENEKLTSTQEKIITISAYTAQGNLDKLKIELNAGLDNGLTINEIKESLVQLYAYGGFPRSLQAINTFKQVVEDREKSEKKDIVGRDVSPITDMRSKYERGKENQEKVTGQTAEQLKNSCAFTPIMDEFLTEHLFADIFERDILTFQDREIITVSALASMGGVEPMLAAHINGAKNVGVSESQLNQLFDIIEKYVGKEKADTGRGILNNAITNNSKQIETIDMETKTIFPKGQKNTIPYFIGTSYLQMLMSDEKDFDCSIGNVTFEKGCRNNWHSHPGGQILLVTQGEGYFQQKGKPIQIIKAGDVVEILPNVVHWHGATPNSEMTHIAISTKASLGAASWGDPVTDEEYTSFKR